jgi:hypothetical protein
MRNWQLDFYRSTWQVTIAQKKGTVKNPKLGVNPPLTTNKLAIWISKIKHCQVRNLQLLETIHNSHQALSKSGDDRTNVEACPKSTKNPKPTSMSKQTH